MNCKTIFNHCELCGNEVSYKTKENILIQHYVKGQEIYIDIQNYLEGTELRMKNILLMVMLILMVLLN